MPCKFLAWLMLLTIPLLAQRPMSAVIYPADTTTARPIGPTSHSITLDVAVTDKSGAAIRGLQKQDFLLTDDNHPKDFNSFRAVDLEAGTPAPVIEIVLVVDAINADPMKMEHQRDGVKSFLMRNGGRLAEPVSLVVLSDSGPNSLGKASTDGNALAALLDQNPTGLRTINRSQGFFGVFDRFQMSISALESITASEARKPGRKLVIWVSPGWPMLSRSAGDITNQDQRKLFGAITQASNHMRLGHITLYNVETRGVARTDMAEFNDYKEFLPGVKSPEQAYPEDLSLQVLAVQTGGLVLNGSNDLPSAIADEIVQSAMDARSFYVLTFPSDETTRPNEYHAIKIKVDKAGDIARTRTGYYAQR